MNFRNLWDHIPDSLKHLGDVLSVTALIGSIVNMLPLVASALTIVWTIIRIYETATVQRWVNRGDER